MYLSTYCKVFSEPQNTGMLLLFSTKTAAIARMPASLNKKIDLTHLSEKDMTTLRKLGILVHNPEKEKQEMLGFLKELNALNRILNLKVVMNLDCNLNCLYCFEGKRKGRYYMSGETAGNLVQFIAQRADQKAFKEIHIAFYGGEPLLSRKLIISVAEQIRAVSQKKGIAFNSSIVTNGTLLTKETVKKLKPLGLQTVYVTLDGPKSNHDRYRPYKSGKGSFQRIMRNIKDIHRLVDLQINGNFTKENYYTFPALLDFLIESGLTPERLPHVRFFPVLAEDAVYGPDFHEGCLSVNEPWLFEAGTFLREEVLKRGYLNDRVIPGTCMMGFRNNFLVNYNGDIYKCPGMIGREEFRVGDIKTGIKDYRLSHNLDNWKNDECLNCSYLPLCFGGCRYMKLVRDGSMEGVDCKKPYLDAALRDLVFQDIEPPRPCSYQY